MKQNHFNAKKATRLDSEERIRELRPIQLFRDVVGITQGMTCVDLGCGTGTFSFLMALCVGNEGIVYAVDDNAEMLRHLLARRPPPNLRLIHCDAGRTGLYDQIADLCLLALILHEVEQPDILVGEAFRLLKPQGKVLVVEWQADLDSPGPPRKRRLSKEYIERLLKNIGLYHFEYLDWSRNYYLAMGSKKG